MPLLLLLSLTAGPADLPVVAIDPGHGGDQNGAVGICGAVEKDLTLAISRELANLLEASGRAQTVLTRDADVNIELEERARIAHRAGAALLISVHANASTRATTRGIETYYLSRRGASKRAAALVLRENDGREVELPTPTDELELLLQGLSLQAAHAEGQRLAIRLQQDLDTHLAAGGRGVLQEPFIVLLESRVPAVLVEVGFLTNAEECKLLATVPYQRKLARVLMIGTLTYLAQRTPVLARR